jgi:hypothetical protein
VVRANSHKISRVSCYLGILTRKLYLFYLRGFHPLWLCFPTDSTINKVCNFLRSLPPPPYVPRDPQKATPTSLTLFEFGLFPFRSPLLGEYLTVSFPPGTEMFHFPGLSSRLTPGFLSITLGWFAYSGICGSKATCASPQLIAA